MIRPSPARIAKGTSSTAGISSSGRPWRCGTPTAIAPAFFPVWSFYAQLSQDFLDPMFFGVVRYGEAGKTGYNLIDFAYTKRFQFHGDGELRILLQCYDPLASMNRHMRPRQRCPRESPLDDINPLHSWVPDCKRRRIDLKSIVTEIRLAPSLDQETADEIRLWVLNKNFTCLVRACGSYQHPHSNAGGVEEVPLIASDQELSSRRPEGTGLAGARKFDRRSGADVNVRAPPLVLTARRNRSGSPCRPSSRSARAPFR